MGGFRSEDKLCENRRRKKQTTEAQLQRLSCFQLETELKNKLISRCDEKETKESDCCAAVETEED